MVTLKAFTYRTLLLASGLAIACAGSAGPTQDAADSRVQVSWTNPADFSEAKQSYGTGLGRESPDEWLRGARQACPLPGRTRAAAGRKPAGDFTNVQRAGTYEPWRGPRWDDVRIIKDIYPPRIDLTFTLTDASGAVVKEGKSALRDPAFLQRGILNETDPLRFEKRMLDEWMRSEISDAGDTRG